MLLAVARKDVIDDLETCLIGRWQIKFRTGDLRACKSPRTGSGLLSNAAES
ncbi:MAG: hypothetical protein AAFN59_00435 [Pseudomonadota bacterium]